MDYLCQGSRETVQKRCMKKNRFWLFFGLTALAGLTMITRKKINPVIGKITSGFGNRIHPVTGKQEFHNGVDVLASLGTPVKSPDEGTVLSVYFNSVGGNQVIIRHPGEMVTGYAHLEKALVRAGQKITAGHVIGQVGNTGQVTGAHLHFTLKKQGVLIDPLTRFSFQS